MNIVCLYWEGDFRKRDYTLDDVERLHKNVDKYIDRDYNFYCLSNVDAPNRIPLKHNWPGWWSKMELHRPDLPKGRTLYLDLDSHIVSSLKPILDFEGDLVMFKSDKRGNKSVKENGVWVNHHYQAATMLFTPGKMKLIYDEFESRAAHYMNYYRSDQDIMADMIPDQPVFPDRWMTKLRKVKGVEEPIEDVIIVTGRPGDGSFREIDKYPWIKNMAYGI